jgi:hypothetical protein
LAAFQPFELGTNVTIRFSGDNGEILNTFRDFAAADFVRQRPANLLGCWSQDWKGYEAEWLNVAETTEQLANQGRAQKTDNSVTLPPISTTSCIARLVWNDWLTAACESEHETSAPP